MYSENRRHFLWIIYCKVGQHSYNGPVFDMNTPTDHVPWWRPGLIMFARLSAWTCVPVLFGYVIGSFVDTKLKTEPIMLILLSSIAFIIAVVKIYSIAKKAMDEVAKTDTELHGKHGDSQNDPE